MLSSSSSSSSSSNEDDEFIQQMCVRMMRVSDVGVDEHEGNETWMGQDGVGIGPNRKRARKFNEAGSTPEKQRRRDHNRSPWAARYFTAPLCVGSLAFDSFREKLML